MPELPEVEVTRLSFAARIRGARVTAVRLGKPLRWPLGVDPERIVAQSVGAVSRRGKYLWLPLDSGDAIIGHLGMSGQLLMQPADAEDEKHLRIRFTFTDDGPELRFIDQRTFGGLSVSEDGAELPHEISHIARDPMDPLFDDEEFVSRWHAKHTEAKRALLDQTLISGVGNIYADEALWRARLHGARPTDQMTKPAVRRLLAHVRDVLGEAIVAGGTSFDELYVNVNGESGYFERSLNAYGREGAPCRRCGTIMRREQFMNRSSFSCPRCQPRPRNRP